MDRPVSFPVIDLAATGENIARLRRSRGLSVRDVQAYFGFAEPQAVYKWQRGESLPTVDNLYALSALLEVPMEKILVSSQIVKMSAIERQEEPCRSLCFLSGLPGYGGGQCGPRPMFAEKIPA